MDFLLFIKNNKLVILFISILLNIILLISTSILIINITNNVCDCENISLESDNPIDQKEVEEDTLKEFSVEVKGAVNAPGVYKVFDNYIINDVIKMAGGFKSDAFTDNINLSHHLEDELVIYVYTKNEYKKNNTVVSSTCNCPTYDISICTDNKSSIITSNSEDVNNNDNISNNKEESSKVNGKVNINTASKKELMTLSGIGEDKANDIINYRNNNGLFKSIEDIKKVNGIKDGTFNKIKDSITV